MCSGGFFGVGRIALWSCSISSSIYKEPDCQEQQEQGTATHYSCFPAPRCCYKLYSTSTPYPPISFPSLPYSVASMVANGLEVQSCHQPSLWQLPSQCPTCVPHPLRLIFTLGSLLSFPGVSSHSMMLRRVEIGLLALLSNVLHVWPCWRPFSVQCMRLLLWSCNAQLFWGTHGAPIDQNSASVKAGKAAKLLGDGCSCRAVGHELTNLAWYLSEAWQQGYAWWLKNAFQVL